MIKYIFLMLSILISLTSYSQIDKLIEQTEKLPVSPEIKFIIFLLGGVIIVLAIIVVYLYKGKEKLHNYILSITEKAVISVNGVENVLNIIKENNRVHNASLTKDHTEIKGVLNNLKN